MSDPIKFNPFTQTLQNTQRLRILNGELTVEDKAVRAGMSGWNRFWTRGQYSQTTILQKMGKIYKNTQDELDKDRDVFKLNFLTLEGRATAQNEEFKDVNSIVRFFEAKSFIDVASFHKKFQKIDDKITQAVNDKRVQEETEEQKQDLPVNKNLSQVEQNQHKEQIDTDQEQLIPLDQIETDEEWLNAVDRVNDANTRLNAQIQSHKDQRQEQEKDAKIARVTKLWKDKFDSATARLEELKNTSLEDFKQQEIANMIAKNASQNDAEAYVEFGAKRLYDNEIDNLEKTISRLNTNLQNLNNSH